MQFILQAGFSTAEQVTRSQAVAWAWTWSPRNQTNGRQHQIYSQPGAGTNFIVRLPFTVSVNRALMVRMGEDLYAIPLNNIQGIVRIPAPQILKMYAQPSAERKYEYAGVEYQVDYLGHLLDDKTSRPTSLATLCPCPCCWCAVPCPLP